PAAPAKRELMAGEAAVQQAAVVSAKGFAVELSVLGHALVQDPQFRLAGAAEVLRQFLTMTDRVLGSSLEGAAGADATAIAGYDFLVQYTHFQRGLRKPAATEIADALRQFPRARYQAFIYRQLV